MPVHTEYPLTPKWLSTSAKAFAVSSIAALFCVDASAASFHCTGKSSASEHIVCKDERLSALDDKLAVAFQRAQDTAADPRSIEADRTQQWLWRQHNCTDKACVRAWYERRIAELDADYEQAKVVQNDAFEAALSAQKLAPSAEAAVRQMKKPAPEVAAR
jgi:uncharacterized protein